VKPRVPLLICGVVLVAGAIGAVGYRDLAPDQPSFQIPSPSQAGQTGSADGALIVTVAPNVQQASGIEVAPLAAAEVPAGQVAYATVVDLKPYFDLHNRYIAAVADRDAAKVKADVSAAQYQRQQVLYKQYHGVSEKNLQDAQVAMENDHAKLKSSDAAVDNLVITTREQFGDTLAAAMTGKDPDVFSRLAEGHASVVMVSFPPGQAARTPTDIEVDGPRGQAIAASKISVAPQIDPSVQGDAYLYLASQALPVDMRTVARASAGQDSAADKGIMIPDAAVVWYGGRQWVFVRIAPDQFSRRPIGAAIPVAGGLVADGGFKAGEKLVVQGAQLLLSQELQPKDITTTCKDPPECDD